MLGGIIKRKTMKTKVLVFLLIGIGLLSCNQKKESESKTFKEDSIKASSNLKLAKKLIEKGYYYSAEYLVNEIDSIKFELPKLDSIKGIIKKELGSDNQEYERKKEKKWGELTVQNTSNGVIWIYQKYFPHFSKSNLFSIYYGVDQEASYNMLHEPRYKITYTGKDWLYFKKIYLSYQDSIIKELYFIESDKTNESDEPIEIYDSSLYYDSDSEFLFNFSLAEHAKIKLIGKDTLTRELSQEEKSGILDLLESYIIVKETLK